MQKLLRCTMRRRGKILAGLCMGVLVCMEAGAVSSTPDPHRYGGIAGRNAFGLRTQPTPAPLENPAPPPPKIKLTGITTLPGGKRALFKLLLPAQPGQPAKEDYLTLAEGQRKGNIEVLQINEKARTVEVDDFGTVMTVTFDKPQLATTPVKPVAALPPSAVPPSAIVVPSPASNSAGRGGAGSRSLPNRLPRVPPVGSPMTTPAGAELPPTGYGPYGPEGVARSPEATPTPNQQAEPSLTPNEEMMLQELRGALYPQAPPATGMAPNPALPPSAGVLPPGAGDRQQLRPPLLPQ